MKFTIISDSTLNSAMFHRRSLNSRFHNQLGPSQLSQLRGSLHVIARDSGPGPVRILIRSAESAACVCSVFDVLSEAFLESHIFRALSAPFISASPTRPS